MLGRLWRESRRRAIPERLLVEPGDESSVIEHARRELSAVRAGRWGVSWGWRRLLARDRSRVRLITPRCCDRTRSEPAVAGVVHPG